MKTEVKITGLDGVLNTLRALPPELVSKRGGVALASLRKGARLILNEARANLAVSTSNNPSFSTGLSAKSLGIVRRALRGNQKGEAVRIRMKRVKYPDSKSKRRGRRMTTDDAAWMLEYGTVKQPAEPWLRPAVRTKGAEAVAVISEDLRRRIDLVVKKLAKMNGGR